MMEALRHAYHPTTNENISAWSTAELDAQLANIENAVCEHTNDFASVPIKNGNPQIWEYCKKCGQKFGSSKPRKEFVELPPEVEVGKIADSYQIRRQTERFECVKRALETERQSVRAEASKYRQYMDSEAWKSIRRRVFERENFLCQGCREKPAEEVHHLTYDNQYHEFLFELVAVCPTCHSLIHFQNNPTLRSSNYASEENCLCVACRWQTSQNGHIWCAIYELPGLSALRSFDKCRDGNNGYEGLR